MKPITNTTRIAFEICDNYLSPCGILGDCFSKDARALAAALAERFNTVPTIADYIREVREMIRTNAAPAVNGFDFGEVWTALTESVEYCEKIARDCPSDEIHFLTILTPPARRAVWECVRWAKLFNWAELDHVASTSEAIYSVVMELPRASKGRGWLWPITHALEPRILREVMRAALAVYY